jgi:hypothetical protein
MTMVWHHGNEQKWFHWLKISIRETHRNETHIILYTGPGSIGIGGVSQIPLIRNKALFYQGWLGSSVLQSLINNNFVGQNPCSEQD